MKTKSLKQTVTFDATPKEIYHLLMDQKKHAAFTHSEVVMSTKKNGKFSIFDGYCEGYNIELKEGKKIVQGWHFAEDGWPDDHYSICTFTLEPAGKKTKLTFEQTNIPEHKANELKSGWKDNYWEPMKEYLETIKFGEK